MTNSLGAFQTKMLPEYHCACLIVVNMMRSEIENENRIVENDRKVCDHCVWLPPDPFIYTIWKWMYNVSSFSGSFAVHSPIFKEIWTPGYWSVSFNLFPATLN